MAVAAGVAARTLILATGRIMREPTSTDGPMLSAMLTAVVVETPTHGQRQQVVGQHQNRSYAAVVRPNKPTSIRSCRNDGKE